MNISVFHNFFFVFTDRFEKYWEFLNILYFNLKVQTRSNMLSTITLKVKNPRII